MSSLPALPLPGLVIPKVTVASLVVYGVMGGLGVLVSHVAKHKIGQQVGGGLTIAACVGAGYAISHAIVANVAPETVKSLDGGKET